MGFLCVLLCSNSFDLAPDAEQVIDIVVSVQQAGLFIIVDLECLAVARAAPLRRA